MFPPTLHYLVNYSNAENVHELWFAGVGNILYLVL